MTDTIVLGLDGANWQLLEPWLESGDLPNIQSLRKEGTWSDMQSCPPPVTCPNWRCYSTGKNPGKLGVFWWETIDTQKRSLSTPTSRSFKSSNYWDYLNAAGKTVGIMNLPMTYPPFEVDGWMVAGGPDCERYDYAYPPGVGVELKELDYQVHPDVPVTSNMDFDAADALVELIDRRFESFRYLLRKRPVDVAHLTIFYINVLQHFFWRDDITRRGWKVIDKHVGYIRDSFPDSAICLISDHGCTKIDTVFYVNSWLEKKGYLVTESGMTNGFSTVGLNKTRLSRLAHKFGIHGLVTRFAPEKLVNSIPQDKEGFKREQKLERVNWKQSSAIASGQGLVYTIDNDIIDDLVSDLDSLNRNNRRITNDVHKREKIYSGEYVHKAPNIIFDQREGVHTSGAIGDKPTFTDSGKWKAENIRTGLFLAAGIGPDENRLKGDMSITDVAPTLLHHLGVPVPTDMDGDPRLVGAGPVEFGDPIPYESLESDENMKVAERLEGLGYLE